VFQDSITACHGVALDDSNNVYVGSTWMGVHKYNPAGERVAVYNFPAQDVAIDHQNHIFVLYDRQIIKLSPDGTEILRWNGEGTPAGRLSAAVGMGLDRWGNIYVADTYNNRVVVFSGAGFYISHWGIYGSGPGEFRQIEDVAVDDNGFIYVSDAFNGRIQKFGYPPTNVEATTWGHLKTLFR
jgi:DNA-binding beta-propeller fold protein YncE